MDPSRLRDLPSVDRLATSVAKAVLAERRDELLGGARDDADLVERAAARLRPSLRRVVNATGVIVHTNLGRAPLSDDARAAVLRAATGYSNLELDLGGGRRGSAGGGVARRRWARGRRLARAADRDRGLVPDPRGGGAVGLRPARGRHDE